MKILGLLGTLLLALSAQAQSYPPISNGGFEQWQPASMPTGAEAPSGWSVQHTAITLTPQVLPLVSKSTDFFSGQYSLVLRPVRSPQLHPIGSPNPGEVCQLTYVDSSIQGPIFPKRLTGKYRLLRDAGRECTPFCDSCVCISFWVSLYSNPSIETFSYFNPPETSIMQWTDFAINIDTPFSSFPVQYARIVFGINNYDSSANPTTQVMLDDLRWDWGDTTTAIGSDATSVSHAVSIYPNPASETLTFYIPSGQQGDWLVSLYTLYGQKIKSQRVRKENSIKMDVSTLAPGSYYYSFTGLQNGQISNGLVTIVR